MDNLTHTHSSTQNMTRQTGINEGGPPELSTAIIGKEPATASGRYMSTDGATGRTNDPRNQDPRNRTDRTTPPERTSEQKNDPRNLIDDFKGMPNEQIFSELEKSRSPLEIAIENVEHDFNIGSIIRTANSFNVSKVHIIGKKKYNRRGAMCTDKYLRIIHHASLGDFLATQEGRELIAIENNTPRARPLMSKKFVQFATLIFGSENNGITPELLARANDVRFIESFGSTRSVNVGVAAGIAMYEYIRQTHSQ